MPFLILATVQQRIRDGNYLVKSYTCQAGTRTPLYASGVHRSCGLARWPKDLTHSSAALTHQPVQSCHDPERNSRDKRSRRDR